MKKVNSEMLTRTFMTQNTFVGMRKRSSLYLGGKSSKHILASISLAESSLMRELGQGMTCTTINSGSAQCDTAAKLLCFKSGCLTPKHICAVQTTMLCNLWSWFLQSSKRLIYFWWYLWSYCISLPPVNLTGFPTPVPLIHGCLWVKLHYFQNLLPGLRASPYQ